MLIAMNVSGIYSSYVDSKLIGIQSEEVNLYVVDALRHVIHDVFAQLSATLVITISSGSYTLGWFEQVLANLISTWSTVPVQMLRTNRTAHVPGRKYSNLLLVDSYESLCSTRLAEDNADYDDHEYYFIFLQTRDAFMQRELQLILEHCLHNYWLHCNVMVQTAQVEVLVYSYYPYTEQGCQTAQPKLINRFDGERMVNAPMFPHKLRQLHQCPLTALLWHAPPFVQLRWDERAAQMRADGFEIKLIERLAQRLNFSLIFDYPQNWANSGAMGSLEMLKGQRANLSVGNLWKTAEHNRILSSPMAHYYAPLVATVAIDKFRFGSLKLLHFPFQWGVWVTLLAALLVHGVVYVWRWRVNGLQVLELLLGVTVVRLPRTWMQRIIYAHWMYGSIPLRVVYQSLLFHFIRLQLFESLPNSFEQLLDQHFRGLCTSSMLGMLREVPHLERIYESFESISSPYDEAVLDVLHQRGDTRLFAITGLDTTNAYLWATNRQSKYHILTQYVNLQQVVIYMPKHSYFKQQFNDLLRQLDASGFIDYWRRAAFSEYSHRSHRSHTTIIVGRINSRFTNWTASTS
ncbi:ionotropic receptor 21a-like [Drosophila grimshawi]|uniref:ionotropic receptor 21a-like n=1 Tax=Drosophila grimshawi TaxID=7222 RepID=UPI000C86F98D|nr:ionotropic receptor 21a-like [Drosophila grimshawi]